jgi:hypothetical protein
MANGILETHNMYKGQFQFEVSGVKRGFKFGTLSNALFCQTEGIKPKDIQDRILNDDAFIDIDYSYYAALAYCQINKIEVDFSKADVSCWIDEIGVTRLGEMLQEAFKSYLPKNVNPPTTGEQQMNGHGKTTQPLESESVG